MEDFLINELPDDVLFSVLSAVDPADVRHVNKAWGRQVDWIQDVVGRVALSMDFICSVGRRVALGDVTRAMLRWNAYLALLDELAERQAVEGLRQDPGIRAVPWAAIDILLSRTVAPDSRAAALVTRPGKASKGYTLLAELIVGTPERVKSSLATLDMGLACETGPYSINSSQAVRSCVEYGRAECLAELLKDERSVVRSIASLTLLFTSVRRGRPDILRVLLADGREDPNKTCVGYSDRVVGPMVDSRLAWDVPYWRKFGPRFVVLE